MSKVPAALYLAGKVRHGEDDWRAKLSAGNRNGPRNDNFNWLELSKRSARDVIRHVPVQELRAPGFVACGPYIVGRGWANGSVPDGERAAAPASLPVTPATIGAAARDAARRVLLDINTLLLEKADAIFVWLDAGDAYGTIAEMGQAYCRKPIFLAFSSGLSDQQTNELWYSTHMADAVVRTDCAEEGFALFVEWWKLLGSAERSARGAA